jgi:hypothetical protein
MKPDTFKDWHDHAIHGVPGRLRQHTIGAKMKTQRWMSDPRPIDGYGPGATTIRAEVRFDDDCGNGHSTFAVTGDVRGPRNQDIAGGCLHDDIARVFPELAHLIKWHLTSTDGPMHYIANTLYHAGDRDHNRLRKGESRQTHTNKGAPMWTLVAVNAPGVKISGTPTGDAYRNAETAPLFILETLVTGDRPAVAPLLEWRPCLTIGEGKPRELGHARSAAVWPEATDAELCAEPDALRAMLEARLPALLAEFKAAMLACGFCYEVQSTEVQL